MEAYAKDRVRNIFENEAKRHGGRVRQVDVNRLYTEHSDLGGSLKDMGLQDIVNNFGGLKSFCENVPHLEYTSDNEVIDKRHVNDRFGEPETVALLISDLGNFRKEINSQGRRPDMGMWYKRHPRTKPILLKYGGVKAFVEKYREIFWFDHQDSMPLKLLDEVDPAASSDQPMKDLSEESVDEDEIYAAIAERIKIEYHGQLEILNPKFLPRDPEKRGKGDPPRDRMVEAAVRRAGSVFKFQKRLCDTHKEFIFEEGNASGFVYWAGEYSKVPAKIPYAPYVNNIVDAIERTVKNVDGKVYAFGSSVNGFGDSKSDVDLVISVAERELHDWLGENRGRQDITVRCLNKLSHKLERQGFRITEKVLHAKVPIIKMLRNNIECDLSCNNMLAVFNTQLLHTYATLDNSLPAMVRQVKDWARSNGVHGAPMGHLSSYSFTLMVLYYFQVRGALPSIQAYLDPVYFEQRLKKENDIATYNVAMKTDMRVPESARNVNITFNDFLDFYANEYKWGKEVVSVRIGRPNLLLKQFPRLRVSVRQGVSDAEKQDFIQIEDPFDIDRNLSVVLGVGNNHKLRMSFKAPRRDPNRIPGMPEPNRAQNNRGGQNARVRNPQGYPQQQDRAQAANVGYPNNQRRDNAPGFATQDAPRFTGLPDDFQRHDSNRSMNSYQQSPPMNPQRQGPPPGNYTNTNTNKHAREKSRERNRERRDNNSKQDVVKQTNREGMRLLTRQQVEQRGDRDVQMLSPRAASRDGSQASGKRKRHDRQRSRRTGDSPDPPEDRHHRRHHSPQESQRNNRKAGDSDPRLQVHSPPSSRRRRSRQPQDKDKDNSNRPNNSPPSRQARTEPAQTATHTTGQRQRRSSGGQADKGSSTKTTGRDQQSSTDNKTKTNEKKLMTITIPTKSEEEKSSHNKKAGKKKRNNADQTNVASASSAVAPASSAAAADPKKKNDDLVKSNADDKNGKAAEGAGKSKRKPRNRGGKKKGMPDLPTQPDREIGDW